MSANIKPTRQDGEIDFKLIKKRFIALNQERLDRTRQILRERQRDFLDILPLLFNGNYPMLPGYVSKDTPAGIPGYQPGKSALEAAKRLARSFQHRRNTRRRFPIQALYIMGSTGTVAHSEESDFDIWLCHEPGLNENQRNKLQRKAEAVATWASSLDLEAHFFLVDAGALRHGKIGHLSSEGSGTTQHHLLLDEFYRTGLCIAGQYPLWWLVPPEKESDYENYVTEIKHKRFPYAKDHIDFGGLAKIPAEEFFGATLWQLYKGIDAPYKSVLKLLLTEVYASEYPHIAPLSLHLKQMIYEGEGNIDQLDPYRMILEKVEIYLKQRNDTQRLELARRCFYFKVNEPLSLKRTGRAKWQRQLLKELVNSWGWKQVDLEVMDNRDTWKVHRVAEERRILFEALSESYRFLSDFARRYAGLAMISQHDLNILGRKLYSAFERKAGKIELLIRGISQGVAEPQLSLVERVDEQHSSSWQLYSGTSKPEESHHMLLLKHSRSVMGLITWAYFNRILDRGSSIRVLTKFSSLTSSEIKSVVNQMYLMFPDTRLEGGSIEDFSHAEKIVSSGIFINVGVDPAHWGLRNGYQMTSGRSDALSYGANSENMVQDVDLVLVTNWQQVLTFNYAGSQGMMECLCEYLKWYPLSTNKPPKEISVRSFSAYRGNTSAHRIEELFKDVVSCYYIERQPPQTRYVVAVGWGFHVLYFEQETPRYKWLDDYTELLNYLGKPQTEFSTIVFDRHTLPSGVLPLVCQQNRPGLVQFFYRQMDENSQLTEIYVLDENGSLYFQQRPFHNEETLLSHYNHFFENITNRMSFLMHEGQPASAINGIEFHTIKRDARGKRVLYQQGLPQRGAGADYIKLLVIVELNELGKTNFVLYCNNREFSTLEYGSGLFDAVAGYILSLRGSVHSYPIYITDISISRPALTEAKISRVQTRHFLTYKQRIEDQLNHAMNRLD